MPHVVKVTRSAGVVQAASLLLLLFASPLARASTPRWAFCGALWLGLLAFSALVIKRLWAGQRLLPRSPLGPPLVVFIVLALISSVFSIYRTATVWAFLRVLLYLAVFHVALDLAGSRRGARLLIGTVIGAGVCVAFIGFVKYHGGEAVAFNSTFVNYDHLAGYMEMVLCLGLGVFFHKPGALRFLWPLLLGLILVALLLSLSRGGWVGGVAALDFMWVLFLIRRRTSSAGIWLSAAALVLVAGLTILASNPMIERLQSMRNPDDPSLGGRLVIWQASTRLIAEHPLHGSGLGAFPWAFPTVRPAGLGNRVREAHNDYVQIVTELGLPVLIPLLWGIWLVFRRGISIFLRTAGRFRAGIAIGSLGGIVSVLVHGLVDFNLQITANGILFSTLVALAVGPEPWLASGARPNRRSRPGPPGTDRPAGGPWETRGGAGFRLLSDGP
ncbi:MAG: hypothetical protein COT06_02810 [Syntrophobacteraceae bacterium CG07_land_8_20_14_0_80_61_8]|nr:MAG: hypothetical protein COT06_02810 [Syntrophobacteraceae bacterium CG07_land_8_20_14_0_80_61_8]